jgi:hypothetical protein
MPTALLRREEADARKVCRNIVAKVIVPVIEKRPSDRDVRPVPLLLIVARVTACSMSISSVTTQKATQHGTGSVRLNEAIVRSVLDHPVVPD